MAPTSSSLAPAIGRALSGGLAVSTHETDQRIMDAVIAELLVTPLSKLSVEDVAGRAGITRMTVYRRFGNREGLIETTVAREVSRFLNGIAAADDPTATPAERIADAFATALGLTHAHPLIAHWLATDPGELLNSILADDAFVVAAGSAFIAAGIATDLAPARDSALDPQRAGELLTRLFAALVLIPPTTVDLTDSDQARQLARELIAPLIIHES